MINVIACCNLIIIKYRDDFLSEGSQWSKSIDFQKKKYVLAKQGY
jgi:hypothetical protein